MAHGIYIACLIAPLSEIIVLTDEKWISGLKYQIKSQSEVPIINLKYVSIESLTSQALFTTFKESAKVDRDFRDGFWLETANRFMLMADLMLAFNLKNCLHLENDNVLYFDPTSKIDCFRAHARFAVPFDRKRAIPGIVWYRDAEIAKDLASYIQNHSDIPDFDAIRMFCDSGEFDSKPLPTMSPKYALDRGFSKENYAAGYENFGGIFDAAAIGQYIGGVDPRNIPGDSRFFINETSDLDLSKCRLIWDYFDSRRIPAIDFDGEYIKVLSIHAHSKDSLGPSPFNRFVLDSAEQVITGECIQEVANITIASDEVIKFHGEENIRSKYLLKIPKLRKRKNIFKSKVVNGPPDELLISACKKASIIFIYTHLLDYFEQYILRRLDSPFILISHNSDDAVTVKHLGILNYPFLKNWYAQNCEFSHNKLIAIPIGLANRQWGKEKVHQLICKSGSYKKSKLVYSNFSTNTHPSRLLLADKINSIQWITKDSEVQYDKYLEAMAEHCFCLCPRGNGVDTHRFWEAQYLNTIPIIVKSDWTPSYSNLPILVLEDWGQLKHVNLDEEYVRISCAKYRYEGLDLMHFRNMTFGSKNVFDKF